MKEVNSIGREVEKGINWAGNQIDQSIKQCETGAILVCTILLVVVNYLFLNLPLYVLFIVNYSYSVKLFPCLT